MIKYAGLLPGTDQTKENVALFDSLQEYESKTLSYRFRKLINWINKKFVDPEDYIDYCYQFGHDLSYLTGYSSTYAYLEKEKKTLIPRLLNRSNPKSYQYIYYIFNLKGKVYPLEKTEDENLVPFYDFLQFPGFIEEEQTLDRDQDNFGLDIDTIQTLDEEEDTIDYYLQKNLDSNFNLDIEDTLDSPTGVPHEIIPSILPRWGLDQYDIYGAITRHILLSFEIQFVESATAQILSSTWNSFHSDVKQNKRFTEVPHYELIIPLKGLKVNSPYSISYFNEDKEISGKYESINLGNLDTAHRIFLGSGQFTGALNTLTNSSNPISSPLKTLLLSELDTSTHTAYDLLTKNFIHPNTRVFTTSDPIQYFSEIAVKDENSNLLFYARFPRIEIYPVIFHSFNFQFKLQD